MAETIKPSTKSATKPKAAAKPAPAKATTTKKVSAKPGNALAKTAIKATGNGAAGQTSKVKDDMNNFKDKAAETARTAAERGKEKASEAVSGISKMIRDSAATIDSNVGKNYGDYARSAADAVDGFATKMSAKEVDEIVGDARDFVRKSPAVAIGAAAAIGFVLVRLLRSGRDQV
jgi:ElaB/YqjD/DUF883 family membrane-anchored ribosome-binding protein